MWTKVEVNIFHHFHFSKICNRRDGCNVFFLKKGGTTNTCNISFDQTIIMQTNARALTEINVNIGRIFLVITQSKKPQEVTNPRKKKIVSLKFKYTVSFTHCHKNLAWYLTKYYSPTVKRVYHDHESRWQSAPASFPALFQKHNISFPPHSNFDS